MTTECNEFLFDFEPLGSREVTVRFDGGRVSSDGGGVLLRELERRFGFLEKLSHCFTDHRDPQQIEHTLLELLKQRVFGLCLGYEDLNDHDTLRHDPLLALLVDKPDPLGETRDHLRDRGKALAGKSTLNRLELSPPKATAKSRYKKITAEMRKLHEFLVEAFVVQHAAPPKRLVLDLDATDDPLHGHQPGRFFHGYYDHYCYLPLYIFCGDHPLLALLRPADIDAAAGSVKHLARIVERIRGAWPEVQIVVRADSGFCRDELLDWCETNEVDYVIGLAKNSRLSGELTAELAEAKRRFEATGEASRVFKDFEYRTLDSWSRSRRVIGKAEHLAKGPNPRFVVTRLKAEEYDARSVYEDEYCGRGEMENRIKEQQLCLFADRTSCQSLRANQLRLTFSTVAYVLMRALREVALAKTPLAKAQADTMRLKLFKIGAVVRVSVRRVWIALSQSYPWQATFTDAYRNLTAWRRTAIDSG